MASAESRPIPFVSGARPGSGHYEEFIAHTAKFFTRAWQECGEISEFDLGDGRRRVLMVGAQAQERVLRAPEQELSAALAYQYMVPVFGTGVQYGAPFEIEQQQLKMHARGLHASRMNNYAPIVEREVEEWIADWGDSGEMDFYEGFADLTIKTSTHCLLGPQFRYTLTDEFAKLYHDLGAAVNAAAVSDHTAATEAYQRRDEARERLEKLISDRVRQRRESGEQHEDMLQLYMDAEYSDGSKMSEHEIAGMVIWFMFAGHHTSANTAAWMLVELARHPEYAREVTAEVDRLYAEKGAVDFRGLREMPALQGFMHEILRAHPPLNTLTRRVMVPFDYKGYHIDEGWEVVVCPYVSHHLPEYFPDPDRFDPHRPEPERMFVYIPFGGGPRKCVGNMFAILQVKCIFSTLLRYYEFELVDPPESYEEIMPSLILRPSDPCLIRYKRRTDIGYRKTG